MEELSVVQWNFLVARCRDLKERCLSTATGEDFAVSVPSQGSSLLGRTLTARIQRAEVESIVLEGFFPRCAVNDQPSRAQAGLREWALPYAADSAVTRYLAHFLSGRPRIDAILFNGGSLHPEVLRLRLQEQIAEWQGDQKPLILENPEPDLAVARGAARLEVLCTGTSANRSPRGPRDLSKSSSAERKRASLSASFPATQHPKRSLGFHPPDWSFALTIWFAFSHIYSTRPKTEEAGSLVSLNDSDFHPLPALQTRRQTDGPAITR